MRITAMPKMAFLVACVLVMAGASGASWAGPIVTTWDYVTNTIFTDAEFTDKGPFPPFGPEYNTLFRGTPIKTDDELSWGRDGGSFDTDVGGRSAVTIGSGTEGRLTGGGPVSGSVNTIFGDVPSTASEIGIGVNISHWNNPISATYDELLSGSLLDFLTLTPTTPGSSSITLPPLIFNFVFNETINTPPCAGGTAKPCADLFGILGVPDLEPVFEYDGRDYQANILITDGAGGVAPIGVGLRGEPGSAENSSGSDEGPG